MLVYKHWKIFCFCSSYIFSQDKNTCFKEKFTTISNSEIKVFLKFWLFDCVTESTDYHKVHFKTYTALTADQVSVPEFQHPTASGWAPKPGSNPLALRWIENLRGCKQVMILARHMHTKSFCFCCVVTLSVIRTLAVYLGFHGFLS